MELDTGATQRFLDTRRATGVIVKSAPQFSLNAKGSWAIRAWRSFRGAP